MLGAGTSTADGHFASSWLVSSGAQALRRVDSFAIVPGEAVERLGSGFIVFQPISFLTRSDSLRLEPVVARPPFDDERRVQLDDVLHPALHELAGIVDEVGTDLEDELIVDLQQHVDR